MNLSSSSSSNISFTRLLKTYHKTINCITNMNYKLSIIMYTTQSIRVKWGNSISSSFSCSNGVKQGGVLSPLMFCIYMDVLLVRLSNLVLVSQFAWFSCYPLHCDPCMHLAKARSLNSIIWDSGFRKCRVKSGCMHFAFRLLHAWALRGKGCSIYGSFLDRFIKCNTALLSHTDSCIGVTEHPVQVISCIKLLVYTVPWGMS